MKQEIKLLEDQVLQGNLNPLEAFIMLKKLEDLAKEVKKKIKDLAIEEISKYNNESKTGVEMLGASITLKKSAGRWNYDHIAEVVNLEYDLKMLKQKHQSAYKAHERGEAVVDTDTGEIVMPADYRQGDDTIMIKIKKDAK